MGARRASPRAVAHRFIDAFNRRDADGLIALTDPDIEFHPTPLVGVRRVYHGHQGLRRWMAELAAVSADHRVALRDVREHPGGFLVLTEVLIEGEALMSSAMVATTNHDGRIVEAHAYFSDEATLSQLGHIPGPGVRLQPAESQPEYEPHR